MSCTAGRLPGAPGPAVQKRVHRQVGIVRACRSCPLIQKSAWLTSIPEGVGPKIWISDGGPNEATGALCGLSTIRRTGQEFSENSALSAIVAPGHLASAPHGVTNTSGASGARGSLAPSFPSQPVHQPQNRRKHNRQNDAGHNRKIKLHVLALVNREEIGRHTAPCVVVRNRYHFHSSPA